jgi:hypothetical protein
MMSGTMLEPPIAIDASRLPILRVTYVRGFTDLEHEASLRQLEALHAAAPGLISIIEAQAGARPTPAQQRRQGLWLKERRELLAEGATAFVMPGAAMRFILSAIFLFGGMPHEYTVVASREAAEKWAHARLRRGHSATSTSVSP